MTSTHFHQAWKKQQRITHRHTIEQQNLQGFFSSFCSALLKCNPIKQRYQEVKFMMQPENHMKIDKIHTITSMCVHTCTIEGNASFWTDNRGKYTSAPNHILIGRAKLNSYISYFNRTCNLPIKRHVIPHHCKSNVI